MFTTTCPACRATLRVGWEHAGAEADCGRCGAVFVARPDADPAGESRPRPAPPPVSHDGPAAAALVLGLLNLVLWACPGVGVLTGGLGIILAGIGLRSRRRKAAILGLLCSVVGLTIALGFTVIFGFFLAHETALKAAPDRGNRPPFAHGP